MTDGTTMMSSIDGAFPVYSTGFMHNLFIAVLYQWSIDAFVVLLTVMKLKSFSLF